MTNNNRSRNICKSFAEKNGWEKDPRRNVVTFNNHTWSFSVFSDEKHPECRQVYEDTDGFIGLSPSGNLVKYPIKSFNSFAVSRISPSGKRAYSVKVKREHTIAI